MASVAYAIRTPALRDADSPFTISVVSNSPGATTATPGGYGAIKSAEILPIALAAATVSVSAKYASRIEVARCGVIDQLKAVALERGSR